MGLRQDNKLNGAETVSTYVMHFCTTLAGISQAGARIRSSSGSTTVWRNLNAKAIACLPKAAGCEQAQKLILACFQRAYLHRGFVGKLLKLSTSAELVKAFVLRRITLSLSRPRPRRLPTAGAGSRRDEP